MQKFTSFQDKIRKREEQAGNLRGGRSPAGGAEAQTDSSSGSGSPGNIKRSGSNATGTAGKKSGKHVTISEPTLIDGNGNSYSSMDSSQAQPPTPTTASATRGVGGEDEEDGFFVPPPPDEMLEGKLRY